MAEFDLLNASVGVIQNVVNNPAILVASMASLTHSVARLALGVRDYHLLEKIEEFIAGYKYEILSDKEEKRFYGMIDKHLKNPEKLYRLIVIAIDRLDKVYKASFLAKLLKAMRKGLLRYDQFDDMCKIIEGWFESDTETLKYFQMIPTLDAGNKNFGKSYAFRMEYARRQRLVSLGLLLSTEDDHTKGRHSNPTNIYISEKLTTYGLILLDLISPNEITKDYSDKDTGYALNFASRSLPVCINDEST